MKYLSLISLTGIVIACGVKKENNDVVVLPNTIKMEYPETRKGTDELTFFGTIVPDPYKWLEDDRSKETEAWVTAENKVTFNYLEQIPYRSQIVDRMKQLWNYERVSAPFKHGDVEYFYKNDGLQNQAVVFSKDASGKIETFLNPNSFSKDGTTSLDGLSFSKDGSLCAYSISEGGSDWRKIYVMDVKTKTLLTDVIIDAKFTGISWLKNEGFYYSSYDKPEGSELSAKTDQHKLYFHKLGTAQKEDQLVFGDKTKRRYVGGSVTDNQKFLIISAANATSGNEIYYQEIGKAEVLPVKLGMKADFSVVDATNELFYILTNENAPNKKLVKVKISEVNDASKWASVIEEKKEVLNISTAGGYFFAQYLKDAVSRVEQYDYEGKFVRNVKLPGIGTANGFSAKAKDDKLYFSFTNYYTPASIYSLNIQNGIHSLYTQPKVDFDTDKYESKQVFYTSKDGTKIPMIITHKKGLKLNSNTPTILYGYGGFNISLTPSFSVANAIWLEMGGIYAVANLRGGGEYGQDWHKAGTQLQKQNVFDDFIAAAEFLIENKYTSSDYLAISGRSNGGLLVGATMTQRPELFKVAFPGVGVLDMLKYHTFTAGAGWGFDYGTADDSKEMFSYLKAYSPVNNVRPNVNYPATMITTGDHDDRVVPAHSYKFAAELQDKYKGNNPMLIRIDVNAGHGAGKSVAMTIQEYADMYAFALFNMQIKSVNTGK